MNRKSNRAQGGPADNSGATDGGRIAFKISEVAKMAGVRPITIRRHIAKGLFAPIRTFRTPLIPASQVEAWLASGKEAAK